MCDSFHSKCHKAAPVCTKTIEFVLYTMNAILHIDAVKRTVDKSIALVCCVFCESYIRLKWNVAPTCPACPLNEIIECAPPIYKRPSFEGTSCSAMWSAALALVKNNAWLIALLSKDSHVPLYHLIRCITMCKISAQFSVLTNNSLVYCCSSFSLLYPTNIILNANIKLLMSYSKIINCQLPFCLQCCLIFFYRFPYSTWNSFVNSMMNMSWS